MTAASSDRPTGDAALDLVMDTVRGRLDRCDPSVLGLYAEALVADALKVPLLDGAWGNWDLKWKPPGAESSIGIQVKSCRTRPTLTDHHGRILATGPRNVSFSIRSAANEDLIWVFALHTGETFDAGWWFFVAPAPLLHAIATKSVSVIRLWSRFGPPIRTDRLATAIHAAASGRQTAPDDWVCPVCQTGTSSPTQLAAHIASSNSRQCSAAMKALIANPGSAST
jgi:hypothetical protein